MNKRFGILLYILVIAILLKCNRNKHGEDLSNNTSEYMMDYIK